MRNPIRLAVLVTIFIAACSAAAPIRSAPLVIDHTCTGLAQIPAAWIDSTQAMMRLHYAHTSHGSQLTTGLTRLENADATYSVAIGYQSLPTEAGALCIFDGQEHDTYITPDEYWETPTGLDYTRDVLDHNPSLNVSMWSWCTQLTSYTEAQTQAYLDALSLLEAEYPAVVFIYMTCNAQATGSSGHNRYLRNQQIRQFCISNNKVLFDFADLDSWWFNPTTEVWEHATYDYGGDTVPVEHPQFNGSEAGHTTYESCEQKGKAVWWMMARLAGWTGDTSGIESASAGRALPWAKPSPNPLCDRTLIEYYLPERAEVTLSVFDVTGRCVHILAQGDCQAGTHTLGWDGRDKDGRCLPGGIYFYRLDMSAGPDVYGKLVILR